MISLQEFFEIQSEEQDYGEDIDDLKHINKNILQFETFLQSNFVIRNAQNIGVVDIPLDMLYQETIEYVIRFLFQKNLLDNVLLFGLKNDYQGGVTKPMFSRTPNTYLQELQHMHWRMLCDIIGTKRFIDCLVNCSVFKLKGKAWIQVAGNRANKPNAPPNWFLNKTPLTKSVEMVSIKVFLYKTSNKFETFDPLINKMNLDELRDTIYNINTIELVKTQKESIDHQLSLLLKNCTKQRYYLPILNSICPAPPIRKTTYHLDLQTPKKLVTKFVLLVVDKKVPLPMFGSKRNKSKIFTAISDLINLPLNGVIHINDVMAKIKTKDLNLLHGGSGSKSHVQARLLFKNFVIWILSFFVPRIIKSFFYCTEVSASSLVIYFRHDIWKAIIQPFVTNYFSEYLIENVSCRNHSSLLLSKCNHSRMRIVPKKANKEFRLIAVPFKGIDEEEHMAFRVDRLKTKIPIQTILNYIRHKRKTDFEVVDSPFQIASKICAFKKAILKHYGTLPELHFMKFDIASCYDSIPRNKVISVLNNLLKQETNFYVSTYTIHNPKDGSFKIKRLVNHDRDKNSTEKLKIDSNQQYFFTTETTLDAVKHELFKTALWVDDKCFLRKDGLFQGSGYSSLLVDILYDDMIQSYSQFKCPEGEHNLIIRIADDFLIVSTSHQQIMNIKELTLSGFGDYNAVVKREKIVVTGSQVITTDSQVLHFCGVDIDIKKLELWKSKQSLNVPLINATSSIETYHRLIDLFKLRLEYHILDGELNSFDTIREQVKILMENISDVFMKAFKNKIVQKEAFFEFTENIISTLVVYTSNIDFRRTRYRQMVKRVLKEEFHKKLKASKLKYVDILESITL